MQKVRSLINRHFKTAMTIWALGVTVLILWGFHDLRAQTNHIQKSRIESCERGYEGTRSVFKPFFVHPGPHVPQKQIDDQRKFNRIINRLKSGCAVQVGVTTTNP